MSKQEIHNETIAVIGLGFVGLPLAMLLISKGMRVIGVDLDKKKVEALRKGTSYISDINDQAVQDGIGTGFFRPVSDYSLIGEADAVIICVPTPLNDDAGPDLNYVKRAAQLIGAHLKKGSSSCWKARHIRVRQETSSNRSWKKAALYAGRIFTWLILQNALIRAISSRLRSCRR